MRGQVLTTPITHLLLLDLIIILYNVHPCTKIAAAKMFIKYILNDIYYPENSTPAVGASIFC